MERAKANETHQIWDEIDANSPNLREIMNSVCGSNFHAKARKNQLQVNIHCILYAKLKK